MMLDTLHANDVEIVSPTFVNQRRLDAAITVIPEAFTETTMPEDDHAETLMFDKGEIAGRLERFREQRDELAAKVRELEEADPEGNAIEIRWRKRQIETLEEMLSTLKSE